MSDAAIQVDLVSDFVCPWCWLGYKQFMAAAQSSKNRPELTFRPYMLDPTVPEDGQDYRAYMTAKFGEDSKDRFKESRAHLEKLGKDYGIAFDFSAISRRPNSLNAHRLLKWAQGQDAGPAVAEAIFRAYHEQGQDIGDTKVLCDIAEQAGLDGSLVRELLARDDDKLEIQQEIMFFRGLGISGVPTFIYNGQFAVQGAQDPATHKQAFRQAIDNPPQG
ncbi:DsbA family protein [Algimonas porphyrae]|uniref:DSBA oxidoreductase n=1 Tax=Algimonas porphyrae TaxID=1128113 RepID=A0ABQ5UW91_9PROT|nr:DsbA family oxidoreductase [Algimonas porphyrae]GLQ19441.1 DSBA oxidoreductase [Algimonas porphyrae]